MGYITSDWTIKQESKMYVCSPTQSNVYASHATHDNPRATAYTLYGGHCAILSIRRIWVIWLCNIGFTLITNRGTTEFVMFGTAAWRKRKENETIVEISSEPISHT